jgi:predicted transcriptional regulator
MGRTVEEIRETITSANNSAQVIENIIEKITNGESVTDDLKNEIQRNVDHLKVVVAYKYVIESNQDVSALHSGIILGESKLAENIWPSE